LPRDRGVGHRIHLQQVQPGVVEPVTRDPPEYAAVAEARGLIRSGTGAVQQRILDERVEIAVVVERLREVAATLERGREAEPNRVAARGARREFMGVEEEQLVVA